MTTNQPGVPWTTDVVRELTGLRELEIAAPRRDGTRGEWTPIWVVVVAGRVYVRTWQRRTTGWYGRAVASAHAWIRVSGEAVEVIVEVAGDDEAAAVDAAYRTKYGTGGAESMVTAEAAASTLRLTRRSAARR